jgi:hypothetical protein
MFCEKKNNAAIFTKDYNHSRWAALLCLGALFSGEIFIC